MVVKARQALKALTTIPERNKGQLRGQWVGVLPNQIEIGYFRPTAIGDYRPTLIGHFYPTQFG